MDPSLAKKKFARLWQSSLFDLPSNMAESLEFASHKFLAELGIEEENLGVFNGEKWIGSGPVITSRNPTTGNPIARIKGVRHKSIIYPYPC
jgi:hypothetical protein